MSAGGGCEDTVSAIARFWWVPFGEYVELLYGMRFALMLHGGFHRCCIGQ